MGFTIQDMLILSKDQYQMELIAGQNGWSNSISWALMLEDMGMINHFTGPEDAAIYSVAHSAGLLMTIINNSIPL